MPIIAKRNSLEKEKKIYPPEIFIFPDDPGLFFSPSLKTISAPQAKTSRGKDMEKQFKAVEPGGKSWWRKI